MFKSIALCECVKIFSNKTTEFIKYIDCFVVMLMDHGLIDDQSQF